MKNPVLSLWLSAAHRAAGFWIGHAASAGRQMQRAALDEMAKAAAGTKPGPWRGPKRKRKAGRKGTGGGR